jgi:hypothetical protein
MTKYYFLISNKENWILLSIYIFIMAELIKNIGGIRNSANHICQMLKVLAN